MFLAFEFAEAPADGPVATALIAQRQHQHDQNYGTNAECNGHGIQHLGGIQHFRHGLAYPYFRSASPAGGSFSANSFSKNVTTCPNSRAFLSLTSLSV